MKISKHSGPTWVITSKFNLLRPRQNGRHFADDVFKCIFLNENVWISLKMSLKFVRKGLINNIPSLVQIMAWRRPGDKPLSEPMMVSLLTHICVTLPRWVNRDVMTHPCLSFNSRLSKPSLTSLEHIWVSYIPKEQYLCDYLSKYYKLRCSYVKYCISSVSPWPL